MDHAARRGLGLAALATSTAVVAALAVTSSSASAAVTSVSPSFGLNSETAKTLTITTDAANGTDYRGGGSARFALSTLPSASFTVTIQANPAPDRERAPQVTVNLADAGDGLGSDGPVDAGTYDVTTTATGVPVLGGAGTDTGATRFTVSRSAAPSVSSVTTRSLRAGESADVTVAGTGFERGSALQFLLPGGGVDPAVTVGAPSNDSSTMADESAEGITTATQLKRKVTVAGSAATGARDVRVVERDGTVSALCTGCFSVNGAPLTGTNPAGGNNDPSQGPIAVAFTGTGLNAGGVPALRYTAAATTTPSSRDSLTILGTNPRNRTSTSITADLDLRNAAPSDYTPVVRNPDGSENACSCTFTVAQTRPTTVVSLDSDTRTVTADSSQPAGSTRSFVVNGTGFSKGLRVTISGTGATAGPVDLLSDTQVRTTITTTAAAAAGPRNVTVTRTDGTAGTTCTGCYTVTAAPTPTPTPTATGGTPTPTPTSGGIVAPTVTVSPSTITASQKSTVSGTAEPNSTVELYAYSRPNTEYRLVRTGTATSAGRFSFTVGPSGNTRLYVRTSSVSGEAESGTTVITVRTSINLKVARTGTRTYRFTGSTLPKRSGQLVTVFYDNGGSRVIASRARVATDGTYNVTRQFSGTGTFTFTTGTGTDNDNAAGTSNSVRTTVR